MLANVSLTLLLGFPSDKSSELSVASHTMTHQTLLGNDFIALYLLGRKRDFLRCVEIARVLVYIAQQPTFECGDVLLKAVQSFRPFEQGHQRQLDHHVDRVQRGKHVEFLASLIQDFDDSCTEELQALVGVQGELTEVVDADTKDHSPGQ